jgi:hypothetical protein
MFRYERFIMRGTLRYENDNEIMWDFGQGCDRIGDINWEHIFPEYSLMVPLSKPYIATVERV